MKIKDKEELRSIIEDRIQNRTSNYIDLNDLDVSGLTSMHEVFKEIKEPNLTLDISKWDTSNVEDMINMFYDSSFNVDISKWDVSNVKDMFFMFRNSHFNGDISKWDVSNVKDMSAMFEGSPFNGDISKWDVSNVMDMSTMFQKSIFNGDISEWNVSNVKDMSYMFLKSIFNGDISKWDVSKVKKMDYMFIDSSFTGDISKWKVPKKNVLKDQIEENKLNIGKLKNELQLIEVVKERVKDAIANGKNSVNLNDLDLELIQTKKFTRFMKYLETLDMIVELDNLNLPKDIKEEVNKIKLLGKYSIFLKE